VKDKKTEMLVPLLAILVIGGLVGFYLIPQPEATLSANKNFNGPFVQIPGEGPKNPFINGNQVCGENFGHTLCCNWAQTKVDECHVNGGKNCRNMDLQEGTCVYS
jgi:hypothetical protein